jgi:hypothetical protein
MRAGSSTISKGGNPSTKPSPSFFKTRRKIWLFASSYSCWQSHRGSPLEFLRFPEVLSVLSSTLWCHSWLSSPSSDVAAVCCWVPLFILPSWCVHSLLLSIRTLWIPRSTTSLVQLFLMTFLWCLC